MSKLLQNSGTRLPHLMNISGFHHNAGEGNKSLNAMSPDLLLSEAFRKGSGRARLRYWWAGRKLKWRQLKHNQLMSSQDLILVHAVQLKPTIKVQIS